MKRKLIIEQGHDKYYKIMLVDDVNGTTNADVEALFKFIGEHKPYRQKNEVGSAYKQIRIKTDVALGITKGDKRVLKTSKREIISVAKYYKYLNPTYHDELFVKIPYRIAYIFDAIKELIDEIREDGYNIPQELEKLVGLKYRVAFYSHHVKSYRAVDRANMTCEAQLALRDDFRNQDSSLNQIFK